MKKIILCFSILFLGSCFDLLSSMEETSSGSASVRIINNSSYTIYYFYISPRDSSTWGKNRLEDQNIISGSSYTIGNLPSGFFDMKVEGFDHQTLLIQTNVELIDNKITSWTIGD